MARSRSDVVDVLATAALTVRGYLTNASNHTLLVSVGDPADGLHAVYKPAEGERPLWDFPRCSLHRREVAAFELSRYLGWSIVPPTVLRDGPMGVGSVQLFVAHDPGVHYFVLVEDPRWHPQLQRIAYFDLLVNNADRKGGHILRDARDHALVGIDHGVTFHAQPKLRTVIWDLPPDDLDPGLRDGVGALDDELSRGGPIAERLGGLLAADELDALRGRAGALRGMARLPQVPADRRPYPWPPL